MNRTGFDPGPLAEASYHAEGDRWTLVFVRVLPHPRERVWAALCEPDQLSQWAPFDADRALGSPGPATLTMVDGDTREAMPADVVRAEPPALLEYTWGDDRLRWELEAMGDGTRLTLRHTVDDRPLLTKLAAGWHLCLVVAERLLDGEPVGVIRGSEAMDYGWQELHDAYAAELGVDATG
jgi:uncharacterized protein YndB with AHSA1/START domain